MQTAPAVRQGAALGGSRQARQLAAEVPLLLLPGHRNHIGLATSRPTSLLQASRLH